MGYRCQYLERGRPRVDAFRVGGVNRWLVVASLFMAFGHPYAWATVGADEQTPVSEVAAHRLTQSIVIDGVLDEDGWLQWAPITTFFQKEPANLAPASERTEMWVLYDDEALYIGARLLDHAPDSIWVRTSRRDEDGQTDLFAIAVDPFLDRRSGYYFGVTAAGTQLDGTIANDEEMDSDWDGVWDSAVSFDERGWLVEMRIPLSQLRYTPRAEMTWGIDAARFIPRKQEEIHLIELPRNASGWVSRFADLKGLNGIERQRPLEVTPYVTTRALFDAVSPGDPYDDGSRLLSRIGGDVSYAITPNVSLNATFNPDFGQVEVDPAVVNLSDTEVFFPEKRPFFVEGAETFAFGRGGANSNWGFNWGDPSLFYTRRVGRAPTGRPAEYDFIEPIDNTRIISAAKITGRTNQGWKFGTTQALTSRMVAAYQSQGVEQRIEVEPLTHYGVVRAQREIGEGKQAIGLMATSTIRDLSGSPLEDQLNRYAVTGGVDGWTFLDKDRSWVATGWISGSYIAGTQARISDVQQSYLHYFQRPDSKVARLDTSRTSLAGSAGRFAINKQDGRLGFNAALGFVSPGFNVNDLGFQWRSQVINGHVVATYAWREPTTWYRSMWMGGALFRSHDFDGNKIGGGMAVFGNLTTLDYQRAEIRMFISGDQDDPSATRGGPIAVRKGGYQLSLEYDSDSRKDLQIGLELGAAHFNRERDLEAGVSALWQVRDDLTLQLRTGYNNNRNNAQYVDQIVDPLAQSTYGSRYVFGRLDQKEVSASIRLNWSFHPRASVQWYAQPLLFAGDYLSIKELAVPGTAQYNTYGPDQYDPVQGIIDPDGLGPANAFPFSNPDFTYQALRSTAVFRWEYRPGSTFFLVWTQGRDASSGTARFDLGDSIDDLVDATANNAFAFKLTYWLSS